MNTKLAKFTFLLSLSLLGSRSSQGFDIVSIRDGSWFIPTNTWTPAILPASGDNVYIAHHVYFDSTNTSQSVTVGNLSLSSTRLEISGPANLMLAGSGSAFTGSNTITGILYNQGHVFVGNASSLAIGGGAAFENLPGSTYEFAGDGEISRHNDGGNTPYFRNQGLLRKSGGTGAVTHSILFHNLGGAVEVDSGTLRLGGGGSSSNGTFTVAMGAVLDWTGGNSSTWAGVVGGSGAGTVVLSNGTVYTSPSLLLNLPAGMFQWTGGSINGTTTNANTITIAGDGSALLRGAFHNQGLVRHTNTATLAIGGGAAFENLPGSTYEFAGDGEISRHNDGGDTPYFHNQGLLRKSGGTGTVTHSILFHNQGGAVQVDSGMLRLSGGGSSSNGTFTVATGAVLDLTGGSGPAWAGALNGHGAGTVMLSNGTVYTSPSLSLNLPAGMFQWTGGSINGTTTNANTITIAGDGSALLRGAFHNQGLVRHTNTATLAIGGGAAFENLPGSTYEFAGDGDISRHNDGGNTPYFHNQGLLRKSGGTGTVTCGITFDNQGGAVEVDSGTLSVNTYAQGGGALTIALGGAGSGQAGKFSVNGAATLGGPLNVFLANNFTPAAGQSFQILACGSRSGAFSATNIPTGLSLTYSNTGVFLLVTSPVSPSLVNPAKSGTNFTFSFQTETGVNYTVQYNDELGTTNWQFFQSITGDGSVLPCVMPMTNTAPRFFRVRQP